MLDIMARREDGPVILCLIGTGQEIHDGEGGLAGWGEALLTRPEWRVLAADAALEAALPRHCLPAFTAGDAVCVVSPAGAGALAALRCCAVLGGCGAGGR